MYQNIECEGWSNYETWIVSLYLRDNGWKKFKEDHKMDFEHFVIHLKCITSKDAESISGLVRDLFDAAWHNINFAELAKAFLKDENAENFDKKRAIIFEDTLYCDSGEDYSLATGEPSDDGRETLYLTASGIWILEHYNDAQENNFIKEISDQEAYEWLDRNWYGDDGIVMEYAIPFKRLKIKLEGKEA